MTSSMFVARLNQLEKAVACFSTAIKLDPFFVDGYIARGNVYMDTAMTGVFSQLGQLPPCTLHVTLFIIVTDSDGQ